MGLSCVDERNEFGGFVKVVKMGKLALRLQKLKCDRDPCQAHVTTINKTSYV